VTPERDRQASGTFLAQVPADWQANVGSTGSDETLRLLALQADASTSRTVDIAGLWTDLIAARLRIADCFYTDSSCFIALTPTPAATRLDRRLSRKKLDVLERVLLRGGQKPVAAELGLAPSTVAIIAGNCLRAMGLDQGASRVPLPITLSIHAIHDQTLLRDARFSQITHADTTYSIVSTPRPEHCLASALSNAEYAVTRLLVEGQSHAQIAARRQTSVRTVANQLAAAFHKLGVSGRCELVCKLVAIPSEVPVAPSPDPLDPEPELNATDPESELNAAAS
jgi:DNA-binding NarL/FixJ family response regulator